MTLTDRDAAILNRLHHGPVWRQPEHVAAETGIGIRAAIASFTNLRAHGLATRNRSVIRPQRERVLWAATRRLR